MGGLRMENYTYNFITNKDCYFENKNECSALTDFYNFPNKNACENCPFFKTEKEFWKGYNIHDTQERNAFI